MQNVHKTKLYIIKVLSLICESFSFIFADEELVGLLD